MSLRTKSAVWDYFLRCPNGEDKMVCRICNSILSGRNASNAKKHMRYSHQSEYNSVVGQDQQLKKRPSDSQVLENAFMASIESLAESSGATTAIKEPKFTSQEKDLLIWLSKPTLQLCTFITDDCKRFIRNFDKNFDLPKRKNYVVNMFFKCARYLQTLVEDHVRNALSRFAVTVNIWQPDNNVMLICVSLNFVDKQFRSRRVFLGSSLLKPGSSLEKIRTKVYNILGNYNITDSQISAFVSNGPYQFMNAFKADYDETAAVLDEDSFIYSCSALGNFSNENDDLSFEGYSETPVDVFVEFPRAQIKMKQIFGSKHVFSLDLQFEYVMSRVAPDPDIIEILCLMESFRRDPDFVARLAIYTAKPVMVSLKPNWKCQFFSARRILEIGTYINQVAQEKGLPTISERQIGRISAYIELLEPFINLICSAQPEKILNEVYGLIQSLVFHCTKFIDRGDPIKEKAEAVRTQLQLTFHDVLNPSAIGISYISAALFNPNQAYLVDVDRKEKIACISNAYEAYKRPFSVKQEPLGDLASESERIETFEEFMLKKRKIEENSKRDAINNEWASKSPTQLAEFYLNLVSTRPANCNFLDFWQNIPVDLDPLVPIAMDFFTIPSMVKIYEFFPTLGLVPNPPNSDLQFFCVRLMLFMNKHILIE